MARTTEQRTISLEPATLRKGFKRAKERGFKQSFSAYVAKLINEDDAALAELQTRENGAEAAALR
jgi:hypothetical protein